MERFYKYIYILIILQIITSYKFHRLLKTFETMQSAFSIIYSFFLSFCNDQTRISIEIDQKEFNFVRINQTQNYNNQSLSFRYIFILYIYIFFNRIYKFTRETVRREQRMHSRIFLQFPIVRKLVGTSSAITNSTSF